MKAVIFTLGFTLCVFFMSAQNKTKAIEKEEMKTYFLVFLKKGPKRDQDSTTAADIQKGHMAHLNKMYNDGKMDLAGPIMSEGDIKGICIYNVKNIDEAKTLAELDPAVRAGRLIVEILPWYSQKGAKLR
jgi:uncharacterized protein YciI